MTKLPTAHLLPETPLWKFSMTILERKLARIACLELQNDCGMNVNVLLFCCWVALSGHGRISRKQLLAGLQAIQKWHQHITTNLRRLRQAFVRISAHKGLVALRQEVIGNELLAEQIEQNILMEAIRLQGTALQTLGERLLDAQANLTTYVKLLNRQLTVVDKDGLSRLLAEIFDQKHKEVDVNIELFEK